MFILSNFIYIIYFRFFVYHDQLADCQIPEQTYFYVFYIIFHLQYAQCTELE